MISKAIWTVLSHLLLCMPLNVFQKDSFSDFSRYQNEADWPVDPWIILFPFSEDECHTSLFLIARDFAESS